jgi:NADP-dependent 3-hydroxy acid dehydrogenase YdfG
MQDLTERTAFATGATSGIGLGIATALSHAGVNRLGRMEQWIHEIKYEATELRFI